MNRPLAASLEDVARFATDLAQNPASALHELRLLARMLEQLPPERAEKLSQPMWRHAAIATDAQVFRNVPQGQPISRTIRMQSDRWIRGLVAMCLTSPSEAEIQSQIDSFFALGLLCQHTGANGRGLFDLTFRLDGDQGFVMRGASGATQTVASTITGDGTWSCPVDWHLQRDQNVEVTITNRTDRIGTGAVGVELPLVVVAFWDEPDSPDGIDR